MSDTVRINRAPVLTLWAAVVAERLGFQPDEAMSLGRALAGLNAQSKGRTLGLFTSSKAGEAARRRAPRGTEEVRRAHKAGATAPVELMGRLIPAVRAAGGLRALSGESPIEPESVARYLEAKFGEQLAAARAAMEKLARSIPQGELAERAFSLYESFRPSVPAGVRGWGAAGVLDLDVIRSLGSGGRARRG